jgi:type VI protein secretion system component VasK
MLAWLALLAIVVGEIVALRWWLNREYYPVLFNGWAILLYTIAFAADAIVVWLITLLFEPGGNPGLQTIAIVSVIAVLLVAVFTLFFRWIIRQELADLPVPDKDRSRDAGR